MNPRSIWSLIATVAIAFAAFTADGDGLRLAVQTARIGTLSFPSDEPVCTQIVEQAVDNDYWDTSTGNIAQKVKYSGGTICQIDLKLKWQSGTSKVIVELWSNPDRTGTQYGSDSIEINTDTATAFYPNAAWAQFTFSTNPTPPGDFWICLVATAGATQWRMDYNHANGATWYPYTDSTDDQNYCAYAYAANRPATDFCFRVKEEQ